MKTKDALIVTGVFLAAATSVAVAQTLVSGKLGKDVGGTGCAADAKGEVICAAFVLDAAGIINYCSKVYAPTIQYPSCIVVGPASVSSP